MRDLLQEGLSLSHYQCIDSNILVLHAKHLYLPGLWLLVRLK